MLCVGEVEVSKDVSEELRIRVGLLVPFGYGSFRKWRAPVRYFGPEAMYFDVNAMYLARVSGVGSSGIP